MFALRISIFSFGATVASALVMLHLSGDKSEDKSVEN
jgi:hypothetical protein